jgi:hypothetical protein
VTTAVSLGVVVPPAQPATMVTANKAANRKPICINAHSYLLSGCAALGVRRTKIYTGFLNQFHPDRAYFLGIKKPTIWPGRDEHSPDML